MARQHIWAYRAEDDDRPKPRPIWFVAASEPKNSSAALTDGNTRDGTNDQLPINESNR